MDVGRSLTDGGGGGVSAVGDDGDRVVSASSSSESEEEEERVAVDVALMLSSTSCKKCVAEPELFRQCCGSGLFFSNPNFCPSRIPDLHQRIPVFEPKKLFLNSRKYHPGCSSRIRILIFYPSRIPGSKRHRIPDPDPQQSFFGYPRFLHVNTWKIFP